MANSASSPIIRTFPLLNFDTTYLLYTHTLANAFVCATKRYATLRISVNFYVLALGITFQSVPNRDTGGAATIQ